MTPGSRNTPSYGRAKEIAVGSQFEFAVITQQPLPLPRGVRLGLWRSTALLEQLGEAELKPAGCTSQVASLPLNPLDTAGALLVYDLISMPPSSLVEHARLDTEWLKAEVSGRTIHLPANMAYTFPSA
jgi:CRISPR-associated protein Csc1